MADLGALAVAMHALPLLLAAVIGVAGYRLGWWRRGLADDRRRARVRAAAQRAAVARLPQQRGGGR
jgi:hypothetical protein